MGKNGLQINFNSEFIILIIISIIIELKSFSNIGEFSILFTISILLIFLKNIYFSWMSNKRDYSLSRKKWNYNLLSNILKDNLLDSNRYSYFILSTIEALELYGLSSEIIPRISIQQDLKFFPDIGLAEKELVDMEKRIGKSMVILIVIPIIFIILNFVLFLNLASMILEMIILLNIITIVSFDIYNPVKLEGWNKIISLLDMHKKILAERPFDALIYFSEYFLNINEIEISLNLLGKDDKPSTQAITSLILIVLQLDNETSEVFIDKFIASTRDLPKLEDIHQKKWDAYSSQFKLISVAGVFFVAILNSIVGILIIISQNSILVSEIEELFTFQINPFLPILSFMISLFVINDYSSVYLKRKTKNYFVLFIIIEYIIINISIITLFSIILNDSLLI